MSNLAVYHIFIISKTSPAMIFVGLQFGMVLDCAVNGSGIVEGRACRKATWMKPFSLLTNPNAGIADSCISFMLDGKNVA